MADDQDIIYIAENIFPILETRRLLALSHPDIGVSL
jgi:hypothetical protein